MQQQLVSLKGVRVALEDYGIVKRLMFIALQVTPAEASTKTCGRWAVEQAVETLERWRKAAKKL